MSDHFATLAQPRRPWLDGTVLKQAFHRATAQHHPDIAGGSGEKAAALNAAYAVLHDPASRVRHLLELEAPEALAVRPAIGAEMTGLFGKIAELRQASAAYGKKNALAQALAVTERDALREEIDRVLEALGASENAALSRLRDLDSRWGQGDPEVPALLAAQQQQLAFLAKWQAQLREDLFHLGG
jgi:curved DNA-binding protein CbpA